MGYDFRPTRVNNVYTTIVVYFQNDWVAEATFNESSKDLKPNEMYASNLWVDEKHRRNGIASALYQMAEQMTGKTVKRTNNQSEDAMKLWNNPNRSFGKQASLNDELKYINSLRSTHVPMMPRKRKFVTDFLNSIERGYLQKGHISSKQQDVWNSLKEEFGLPKTPDYCQDCGETVPLRGGICHKCWEYRSLGT